MNQKVLGPVEARAHICWLRTRAPYSSRTAGFLYPDRGLGSEGPPVASKYLPIVSVTSREPRDSTDQFAQSEEGIRPTLFYLSDVTDPFDNLMSVIKPPLPPPQSSHPATKICIENLEIPGIHPSCKTLPWASGLELLHQTIGKFT